MLLKNLFKIKKGFTLVEVVVASAITAILIAAVIAVFQPTVALMASINQNVFVNRVSDTVSDYVFDRLVKANNYKIYGYSYNNLNSITTQDYVNNYYTKRDAATEKVYAMLISNDNGIVDGARTFGNYKVYDFMEVTGSDTFLTNLNLKDNFSVLNDDYYLDSNYKFTFDTSIDNTDIGNVKVWCNVRMTPFNSSGELISSERNNTFKLLNMNSIGGLPDSGDNLKEYTYDEDTQILILYKIKNFG